jgi:tRNA(Arg) A34 adenosine deaminase TadA
MATDTEKAYIRRTHELAEAALENGNPPFGSILVLEGSEIESSANTTITEEDITAHPELKLARYAARELTAEERAACTMYTSTEPCPMCAGAVYYAGLGRVVYSVAGRSLPRVREHRGIDIPCEEVIDRGDGTTAVDGPVLEEAGLEILGRFYDG